MHFLLAVIIAVGFWHDRGVQVPCHPVAVITDNTQMPMGAWNLPDLAAAHPPGDPQCGTIMVSRALDNLRTDDPAYYCAVIVHEIGHVGGLQHTNGGIMNSTGIPEYPEFYPWACRRWRDQRARISRSSWGKEVRMARSR